MMKQINLLRNNKGFTLVEMIVTLAIFSIVLVVAGNYLFFGNRMYAQSEMKGTEKSIGDNMYAFMREKLVYATALEVIDPSNPKQEPQYENVFKIKDGDLNFNENDLYGKAYYHGYTVSYSVEVQKNSINQFKLTVYVKDGENTVYQTESTIKNLNLELSGKKIDVTIDEKNQHVSKQPYKDPIISFNEGQPKEVPDLQDTLRQQMLVTNQQLIDYNKSNPKDEQLLPDKWEEYMGDNFRYYNNDRLREYVLKRFYRKADVTENLQNYWPKFPGLSDTLIKETDEKIEKKQGTLLLSEYLKKEELVMMAYIFKGAWEPTYDPDTGKQKFDKNENPIKKYVPGDDSCFIYVASRPKSMQSWPADMVYDFEEGCWYYRYKINANPYIQDSPWKIDEFCPELKMTYKEFYSQENIKQPQKIGISDKIHNEEEWIKVGK
ncbi:MAG: prepilin-type N-terminal cleavage/methylation domain-containing protein [Eubacterium sp.]